jgi:hypothetical protein
MRETEPCGVRGANILAAWKELSGKILIYGRLQKISGAASEVFYVATSRDLEAKGM